MGLGIKVQVRERTNMSEIMKLSPDNNLRPAKRLPSKECRGIITPPDVARKLRAPKENFNL